MKQLILQKQQILWLAVGLTAIAVMGLVGWQALMGGAGQTTIAGPSFVTDVSDDRKLVGLGNDVFFGQVTSKEGQTRSRGFPETQFTVTVLETLKGDLSGDVRVNQQGGDDSDGSDFRMDGDPDLLVPEASYLFVTRSSTAQNWHTILSGYGKIKLDVPANSSVDEILKGASAQELRTRFGEAVANEIVFNPSQ